MPKIIIGIVGPIAAGKGTSAAFYKEKHNAETFRFSSPLFAIAETLGMPNDRDHLSRLSRVLRVEFGEDTLARAIAAGVERSTAEVIVVDGVRRPDDVRILEAMPGFTLVYIDAPIETRFARMKVRGEKADDASKTMEEFAEDHKIEAEQLVASLRERARVIIDNSGSLDALHAQLEQVLDSSR